MASTSTLATTDCGDVVVGLGSWWCRLCFGAAGQLWRLLEEFPVLRGRCRAVRTWESGLCLRPRFILLVRCLGVACGAQRMDFLGRLHYLVQQWIHVFGRLWSIFSLFYVEVDSNPEAFFSIRLNERSEHS